MYGYKVLRGSLWTKTKDVLLNTKLPHAKLSNGLRLYSSHNKLVNSKCWGDIMRPSTVNIKAPLALNKRHFSFTNPSYIWTPWGKSTIEPPAIPKDVSSNAVDAASAVKSPGVPDAMTASAADASTVTDPSIIDAVSGAIVDPPFIELGLATKWFPNHFVHQLLEFVHLNTGLEWWSTIIIGTLVIRIVTIPMFIRSRKQMINSQNHSQEMQKHLQKIEKFKYSSHHSMRLQLARREYNEFTKRTGTGPLRMLTTQPLMSVIFITCIMALRQMIAVPVPSLVEGGILWFTDLSIADPYYVLPVITGGLMGLYIHTLTTSGATPAKYAGLIRKAKYLPIVLVPLILGNTSSAIFLYWLTTVTFSLGFQRLLLLPGMKERLKFPTAAPVVPKASATPAAPITGFRQAFKDWRDDSYKNTDKRMRFNEIKREKKRLAKEQKKILKGDAPITYTIGVDALPSKEEVPDFEREWRPIRPKHLGHF